ncbi:MAG: DUF2252 domain-containing protein [Gemmatimonadaceae bacterium]
MSSRDVTARIEAFNSGREPERLALKYREMCKSPFSFFRGSAHLFWEDLARRRRVLPPSPLVWACGDLHLENFGSFQGDNSLSYFDLNDFDEAALAPANWEVSRFVASIFVAAPGLDLSSTDAAGLANSFLDTYRTALVDGKPRWIERATASGMVRTLLKRVKGRERATLVKSRTVKKKGKLGLLIDGKHTLPATAAQRQEVARWLARFAKSQPDPGFYRVLDVARRAAGVGSLGLKRYVVLVRGGGGKEGHAILDAKWAAPSSLAQYERVRQPDWKSEADRVVAIQHRMEAIAPALLDAVRIGKGRGGYVLRELQPSQDRLTLANAKGHPRQLQSIIETMGHVTAWAELRSSGRQGSATIDDLIAFGDESRTWQRALIDYGRSYQRQVEHDYEQFARRQV